MEKMEKSDPGGSSIGSMEKHWFSRAHRTSVITAGVFFYSNSAGIARIFTQ